MAEEAADAVPTIWPNENAARTNRLIHRTIAQVSDAYERFHFNGAVAKIRELSNALDELDPKNAEESGVYKAGVTTLTQLIGPMLPHIAEEMWATLGHKEMLVETAWPIADPSLLVDNTVTIAVQVNGKLRASFTTRRDAPSAEVEAKALSLEGVKRALDSKLPKKVIVVPNKIVNVVA
jgi:leucyl-tRNA synthetase